MTWPTRSPKPWRARDLRDKDLRFTQPVAYVGHMATTRHLSSADVAKELGCNTRQVSRLVTAGTLTPAVQAPGLRGAFLFDPAEVARVKRQQSTA